MVICLNDKTMYTTIKTKEGDKVNFLTLQEETTLYLLINHNVDNKFVMDEPENTVHFNLRKEALERGDTLIAGSIVQYRGELPINKFN